MNPAPSASSDIGPQVNPLSGALVLSGEEDLDVVLEGPLAFVWQRIYSSRNPHKGWLGQGWRSQLEVVLVAQPDQTGAGVESLSCIDMFGRAMVLPTLPAGGEHQALADGVVLRRSMQGLYSLETTEGLTYRFAARSGNRCELTAIVDRNGNAIRLDHSRMHLPQPVLRISCSGGQEVLMHFDQGRLLQVAEMRLQDGRWVSHSLSSYEFNDHGQVTRVHNRAGECMRVFEYNAQHLLCRHVYADSFEAWIEYEPADGAFRVSRHGDNVGQRWTLQYLDDQSVVTDQDGRIWRFHVDGMRRWTGLTDPLGHLTRYGLDRQGRLRAIVDPLEQVTEMRYDEQGNKVEVRDPACGVTQIAWHDRLGVPTAIVDPLGRTTAFEYDDKGNLLAEIEADGATTRYEVDARGLPVRVTDAKGGVSLLAYNEAGLLTSYTDCSARTSHFEYNANGWLVAETDAAGHTTRYDYDAAGRLVKEIAPDGGFEAYENDLAERILCITNSLGAQTRFSYAPDGQLTARVDALGQRLTLHYSGSRQLQRVVNENGASYLFRYDAADRLIEEVQFDGRRIEYAYDAAGRIKSTLESPDSPHAILTRYRRDPLGRLLERSTATTTTLMRYDLAGQLIEARNRQSHVKFVYDDVGQLVEEHLHMADGVQSVRHTYDEMGNRLSTALPGGLQLKQLFYGSGHLHHVALQDETVTDLERDVLHQELSRTQGRLISTRQYDALGRIKAFMSRRQAGGQEQPGAPVLSREVDYDLAGRPTVARDASGETPYVHDLLDRLTQEGQARYRHDPAHNLLTGQDEGVHYTYDVHGRVVEKRVGEDVRLSLVWDDEHRLVRTVYWDAQGSRETSYVYDPFGRRIVKQSGQSVTRYLWDEDRLLQETQPSHRQVYLYEPDSHVPLAVAEVAAGAGKGAKPGVKALRYFHCDQAGVPMALTDAQGQIVWEGRFQAWGKLLSEQGSCDQRLRHQGQLFDQETGLHYNFQRYYDPDTGRFISKDPIGLAGGLNEYQYVASPLFWIDPTGLTGTYIMSGGKKRNYVGKGPKARSQASRRARMKGCPKVALVHKDFKDDEMGFMVEYLLMKHYNARLSPNWANSTKLDSPGKKKYAAASKKRQAQARAKAKKMREDFEKEKKACGV